MVLSQTNGISFKVIDKNQGKPLIEAFVEVLNTTEFAFTSADGECSISVGEAEAQIKISCMGFQEKLILYPTDINLDTINFIKLEPMSLALNEITVTAQKGDNLSTSTRIGPVAMEHTQPTSLYDILQLVPGNLIENPDLSNPTQIKIREISNDANSALGTSIILDGNPLLNDANMQTASTAQISSDNNEFQQNTGIVFPTTVGMGLDLREFSMNNIQSVEVIQGVPSVEYGNITSGTVILKSKAGKSPLQVKLKTDPYTNQFYAGKGFQLKNNKGAVNLSMDYLQSYSDVLSKYEGYDRLNGHIGYFGVFMKSKAPLTLNAKLNVFGSLDNNHTDPDAMVQNEVWKSSDRGFSASVSGEWLLNKKLLTSIKYSLAGSRSHQESYQRTYRTGTQQGISTAMESGENYGVILPSESLTEFTVEGMPYHFFGQFSCMKEMRIGSKSQNQIMVGGDYRLTGNSGEGQQFDLTNPPYVNINAIRPRSYKDIPSLRTASIYMEDKISLSIGKTWLELEAGMRLNNFQANGVFSSDFGFYPEPRANIRYQIISHSDKKLHHLTVRAGAGKLYKAPPLVSLYPNLAYLDLLSLLHYTDDVNYRTVVFTTFVVDGKNPALVPMENTKLEVGLDFVLGKVKGSVTAFREESKNGLGMERDYHFLQYKKYDSSNVPDGTIPDISTLPYADSNYVAVFNRPANTKGTVKQGVEYTIDFNRIPAIYTKFVVDGAWLRISRTFHTQDYMWQPGVMNANDYEWVGMYPAGGGRVEERLNSTLRMITHVPKVSIVFTTSVQVVWFEKSHFPYYYKAPLYVFNDTEVRPFTEEMKDQIPFKYFVDESPSEHFLVETLPPIASVNFRLSKEIGKWLQLSFYANNFLNYRPIYQYKSNGVSIRRNQPLFFGADIRFHI